MGAAVATCSDASGCRPIPCWANAHPCSPLSESIPFSGYEANASSFDRESGVAKVSLAGIHYPDTTDYFGDQSITDVTDQLEERGWSVGGQRLFMADHYRLLWT